MSKRKPKNSKVELEEPWDKSAIMTQVVDSKLTRTELIELVVDRLRDSLQGEYEALVKEAEEIEATSFPVNVALAAFRKRKNDVTIKVDTWDDDKVLKLSLRLDSTFVFPKVWESQQTRLKVIAERRMEVRKSISKITGKKSEARTEVLKQALMSTPEGLCIMEAIDALKKPLRQKLLEAPGI